MNLFPQSNRLSGEGLTFLMLLAFSFLLLFFLVIKVYREGIIAGCIWICLSLFGGFAILGARDFSSAVSGFCQVFIPLVTRVRLCPQETRCGYDITASSLKNGGDRVKRCGDVESDFIERKTNGISVVIVKCCYCEHPF